MGLAIDREDFTKGEYNAFSTRLYDCLAALKQQMQRPNFGRGTAKIGAELENYIVDKQGEVLPLNTEIINAADDKHYTVELNRFNLEVNFDPVEIDAHTFSSLQRVMLSHMEKLQKLADTMGALVVPTGILPTLRKEHLTAEYMTDSPRYRALSRHLLAMRGENFQVDIRGQDEIKLSCDHVALEGANTSFQYHLMVPADEFANCFNATQFVTPLLVAATANSPILLNKLLWDESRIALFKQSIDSRSRNAFDWRQPARAAFGHGWLQRDAWDLFAETVALYPPIFPILSAEDPLQIVAEGGVPKLEELSLHMGTTWPWNRGVYSHFGPGHVRIEMRSMPAGPSIIDMCANAALATGLVMGIKDYIGDLTAIMPFKFAEYNFYRAAQRGLDATIIWPHTKKHQLGEQPISDILISMLPLAEKGLQSIGIDPSDIALYLGIIEKRLIKKNTGARWQRQQVLNFEKRHSRQHACQRMFHHYMRQQHENIPVSEWKLRD